MHTELSEAFEEYRLGKKYNEKRLYKHGKKC